MAAAGEGKQSVSLSEICLDDDFDSILQLLEEDKDLEMEVDAICRNVDVGEYVCDICGKICKSKGGLPLHKRKKHEENSVLEKHKKFSVQELSEMLIKVCSKVSKEQLFPKHIILEVEEFKADLECASNKHDGGLELLSLEIDSTLSFKDTEKFYRLFYDIIVRCSRKYIPNFGNHTGTILLRKLCDELLFNFHHKTSVEKIITKNINDKELAGLQYLGGYILHKMFIKYKTSGSKYTTEYEEAMAILSAGKLSIPNENVTLVNALSRGGLWGITSQVQRIFVIAEKYFCVQTQLTDFRKINVFEIVKKLMEYAPLQDSYNSVVSSAEIDVSKEVAKVTLYGMLTLYIRVRSFTHAKNIVEKHKMKAQKKGKVKSLRKQLKKAEEEKSVSL